MTIPIIPNLEAQKAQLQRQGRNQAIGQALQGFGDMFQKRQAEQQLRGAYQALGESPELAYLPKEYQQEYFKKKFAEPKTSPTELEDIRHKHAMELSEIKHKQAMELSGQKDKGKMSSEDLENLKHQHALELAGVKSKIKTEELRDKKNQEKGAYRSGLDILGRLKELRSKGNLGMFSGPLSYLNPETAKDRGEYTRLAKSLISLSTSGLIIRNQKEFEEYANDLTDPSIRDSEAQGILDAMERIISNNLGESEAKDEKEVEKEEEESPKQLSQEVVNRAYKDANGDPDKAKKILKKMGYAI
jgi:hypothetical protein